MGPFGVLSIIGSIWPRLVSRLCLALVVGFVFFRHDANAVLMWAVHIEAGYLTSTLRHVLRGVGQHACHARALSCGR